MNKPDLHIQYIIQETGVDVPTATVALMNARGLIFTAVEMLSNESYKAICGKQARECGMYEKS